MKRRIFLVVVLMLNVASVWAQTRLSEAPDAFITDVVAMLNGTKNADATAVGKDFEAVWNNKLNPAQKNQLIALSRQLQSKKYKPLPYFKNLYESVSRAINAQNISAPELDQYLNVTAKAIERYDSRALNAYLETCRLFFESRAFYRSNYHTAFARGGRYSFEFKEGEELPAPTPETLKEENNQNGASTKKDGKGEADGWSSGWESTEAPIAAPESSDPVLATYQKPQQPALVGALIRLEGVDLVISTPHDSAATLFQTSGALRLQDGIFVGKGGKFTWAGVGLPDVSAEFGDYSFNIRQPKLQAEGVKLTYAEKLSGPVQGYFEFVSKKKTSNVSAQYPYFISFENNIVIKNIGENLIYRGGFSLMGSRIYSSSLNGKHATLTYQKDGKAKFRTYGRQFELGDSVIVADLAGTTIYQGKDSIAHPGVKFYFNKPNALLRLTKTGAGFKDTPYSDTYHKFDINTDVVRWKLNENTIDFYTLGARKEVPTTLESYDFYNSRRYESLKGLLPFNPLQMLMSYSKTNKTDSFYADDLAKAFKQNPNTIKGAMLTMMQQGYVDYDPTSGLIKLNRKGAHNVYAYAGKKDFDNLLIASLMNQPQDTMPNATLDLGSNVLTVRGVGRFNLSDSLRVFVTPKNREIKLMQNRYFLLEGEIAVGNFKFKGKDFYFNYEEFSVAMPTIDSITFISADSRMKNDRTEMGGEIRYESGTLFINRPDNKSGKKNLPEFPRLSVASGGAIYFDFAQSAALKGTYNKNVYFKIPSIDQDSLNSKDPVFVGTFYSDDIFPPFEERLITMPDKSLGFKHKVPNNTYPLYKGAATMHFSDELVMNKAGLRAPGKIDHLTTTLQSESFLFTPDSTVATGTAGQIKEGKTAKGSFPQVSMKDYSLKWVPKVDSMLITSKKTPFELYKASTTMEGTLVVRSTGLAGSGILRRKDSEISSDKLVMDKDHFTANPAQLKVSSNVKDKPAILGTAVDINFDVTNAKARIVAGGATVADSASLTFPYTNYRTNIDQADWDVNKKMVTMSGDVKTSVFTSNEPSQEGLRFNGSSALYDMEKQTLNIGGVPYIISADARIFPNQGKVTILENAAMQTLKNSKLEIDTLNSYHKLINGEVEILSRSKFTGDATYQYVNVLADTFKIKMGNFESQPLSEKKKDQNAFFTVARGEVKEEDNFFVSSRILFKGNITMLAPEQNLQLDGFIKPQLKSRPDLGSWISYKSNKTENVVITVDEKLMSDNVPLYTGLHFDRATSELYTTFLSPKHSPDDEDAFVTRGTLNYNASINQFKIASEEGNAGANSLVFDDAKGLINLQGKLNLFNPTDYLLAAGLGTINFNAKTSEFNTLLAFNFPLPPQALSAMAAKIIDTEAEEKLAPKEASEDYQKLVAKLEALVPRGQLENYKAKADVTHVPLFEASKKFLTSLVLSNVDLRWSDEQKAFYSVGKIGVANTGNQDINMQMDGFVELRKNPNGDEAVIYLELTPDLWYFWSFRQNQLALLSSDEEFNNIVSSKGKSKAGQYSFFLADGNEKEAILESFQTNYKTDVKITKGRKEKKTEVSEPAEAEKKGTEDKTDVVQKEEAAPADEAVAGEDKPAKKEKKSKVAKSEEPKAPKKEKKKPAPVTEEEEEKDGF